MSRSLLSPPAAALAWTLAALLGPVSLASAAPQSTPRPQLYVVRNVRTADGPDGAQVTLVLRGGRIERSLDATAQVPAGAREIDGKGNLVLPAFVDAFSFAGCVTPNPKIDRDLPPSVRADVLVDMREANRKGIEPAFRAADVLDLAKDKAKGWREAGFGALLSSPGGQLLSGTSALVTTREAAMRDALVVPEAFAHAAFRASGDGYPSTLMGFVAQLRQFFLDARHQRDLEARYTSGRPGPRPPFDADLSAIGPVLAHERRLLCEADSSHDIERWIALADQFDFEIAIAGGREAWRVRDTLAARRIPVVLTLDWGEEPKDPHEKEKQEKEKKEKAEKEKAEKQKVEKPAETPPDVAAQPTQEPKPEDKPAEEKKAEPDAGAEKKKEKDEKDAAAKLWEYEEPLAVREERRRLWEEGRDCAIRLHEAGVEFAFGSAGTAAPELLKKVRTLVEHGLPADAALAALTSSSARILGVQTHLGTLAPGADATLAVWTANPTSKDAKLAWLVIDGFPYEFELDKADAKGGKPDEGVDASGEWQLTFQTEGEERKATAKLEMSKDGDVEGTITLQGPEGELSATYTGHVSGKKMTLEGTVTMGPMEIHVRIDVTLEGDTLSGDSTVKTPEGEETSPVTGTRKPKEVLR